MLWNRLNKTYHQVGDPGWMPVISLMVMLIGLGGCTPSTEIARLRQINQTLRVELNQTHREVQRRDGTIASLQQQIDTLKEFRPNRPADLFAPVNIEIVSRSGGANYDNRPGDDGVTVYLRPVDFDGDPVKAAGDIIIELIDNSVPGSPTTIKVYEFKNPEHLRKLWHSRFGTNHYALKCEFPRNYTKPSSRKITVSATFVDYLTGARLTEVKELKIAFPDS